MLRKVIRFYEVLAIVLSSFTCFHLVYIAIVSRAPLPHGTLILALTAIGVIYLVDIIHNTVEEILEKTDEQYNPQEPASEEPDCKLSLVRLIDELEETVIAYPSHDNAPSVYNLKRHQRTFEL